MALSKLWLEVVKEDKHQSVVEKAISSSIGRLGLHSLLRAKQVQAG